MTADDDTRAALEAAARLYLPRSLPLAGKRPLLPDWPNVVATPERVREWWSRWPDANPGVRTGDGLAVLDVDERHDGDRSLALLQERHGRLPATPEVATGGGGRHLYFRGPKILASRDIAPGVELKAAGCQVVALPWAGFHTFRHTCGSLLIAEGRNIVQVSRWLGHHSPAFTLTVYAHLLDDGVGAALEVPSAFEGAHGGHVAECESVRDSLDD